MKILFYCVAMFCLIQLNAQSEPYSKFGKLTEEEIAKTHCEFDSLAEAVILFDVGESKTVRGRGGFNIEFKRHKRVKIFTEAGRSQATVSIPYYVSSEGENEKLEFIRAITYNEENGTIIESELEEENIFDEKLNKYYRQKKFVFPNVKEGSIIEFVYVLNTPYIFSLKDWNFQSSIPTEYSQYKVYLTPFYDYVRLNQQIETWDVYESKEGTDLYENYGVSYTHFIHTFGLKNIEAFRDESYITSVNDHIKKIKFQLATVHNLDGTTDEKMTTWKDQREGLLGHFDFGRYMTRAAGPAKKILKEELDLTELSNQEKIKEIVTYVKKNFSWNGYPAKYSSKSPKELVNSKTGNAADINLFLAELLEQAEISASPMILSTRAHGKINMAYPLANATNYVVVFLNDDQIILDGTQTTLGYNLIPTYCINEIGLVVNDASEDRWLRIQYNKPSSEATVIDTYINPETLMASSKVKSENTFYKAYSLRESYGNKPENVIKYIEDEYEKVDSVEITGYSNPEEPYKYTYTADSEMEQLGEFLIINPLLNLPLSENPLIMDKRSYPVDFIYPYKNTYKVQVYLPEGYVLSELPENTMVNNDIIYVQASHMYNAEENVIQIYAAYEIKKGVYQPEEYSELKKSLDLIVKTMNNELLLLAE